jgi:hypothetical protein
MASSEYDSPADPGLDITPGEATLLRLSSRASAVEELPRDAYENLLVVTVDAPERIEKAVRDGGGDPENVGIVPVSASPVRYDGPCWTADRVSPSDLTGISIQFSRGERYLREGAGWVVVDGLGTLLMYTEEEKLYRLFSHLISRARERRFRHVTGVDPDVLTSETLARFQGLHDRSIEFE